MQFDPTLSIFLFIYFGFLLIFLIFSLIHIYHVFLSASFTFVSFMASFIIFILSLFTIYGTGYLLQDVNWQQSLFSSTPNSQAPAPPPSFDL